MDKWGSYFLHRAKEQIDNLISVIQCETVHYKMSPQNQLYYNMAYQFSQEFNKFIYEIEKEIQLIKDIKQDEEQQKIKLTKQKYDTELMIKILKEEGYRVIKEY